MLSGKSDCKCIKLKNKTNKIIVVQPPLIIVPLLIIILIAIIIDNDK